MHHRVSECICCDIGIQNLYIIVDKQCDLFCFSSSLFENESEGNHNVKKTNTPKLVLYNHQAPLVVPDIWKDKRIVVYSQPPITIHESDEGEEEEDEAFFNFDDHEDAQVVEQEGELDESHLSKDIQIQLKRIRSEMVVSNKAKVPAPPLSKSSTSASTSAGSSAGSSAATGVSTSTPPFVEVVNDMLTMTWDKETDTLFVCCPKGKIRMERHQVRQLRENWEFLTSTSLQAKDDLPVSISLGDYVTTSSSRTYRAINIRRWDKPNHRGVSTPTKRGFTIPNPDFPTFLQNMDIFLM